MCIGVAPPSTLGELFKCSVNFIKEPGDRDGSGVKPIPCKCCPLPGVCMYELHGEKAGWLVLSPSTRRKPPE